MKKCIYILFLLALVGCTKDVDIDVASSEDKVVVEGRIETGGIPEVYLTKSVAIFEEFDFNDVTKYLIADAIVTISNGSFLDTLKPEIDFNLTPPVVYTTSTPSFIGVDGETYNLKIITDGRILTSTTTIPNQVKLDSVWIKEESGFPGKGFVWAHFLDPDTLGNSYRWEQKLTTETKFVSPVGSTFDDKIINGEAFDFFAQKPFDPNDDSIDRTTAFYYDITDTVIIKFSTIDKASFNFWRTLDVSKSNNGNPFAAPITPITNIDGGLGVFTGYSVSFDTAIYKP
jgi:hypothetical protein